MFDRVKVKDDCVEWIRAFFRENGEIKAVKYDPGDLPINRKSVEYER